MADYNLSFVFVPGMCSRGSIVYESLMRKLNSPFAIPLSDLHALNLPSTTKGASLKPNALEADIAFIRSMLTRLIQQQHRDVVVAAHSYGGTPALAACAGLWKHQRLPKSQAGGVIRVACLASSLSLPGGSVASDREIWKADNPEQAHKINDEGGVKLEVVDGDMQIVPDGIENSWMNDFGDSEEETKVKRSLVPSALSTAISNVPGNENDVKDWRVSYLVTTESDEAMPEAFQFGLIENARAKGADVTVKQIEAGHFMMVSRVEELAEWIVQ